MLSSGYSPGKGSSERARDWPRALGMYNDSARAHTPDCEEYLCSGPRTPLLPTEPLPPFWGNIANDENRHQGPGRAP